MDYFKRSEFECRCGCGLNNINDELVQGLTAARVHAGVPFIITSAARCPEHNRKSGGSASSSHLTGHAVDIKAISAAQRMLIVNSLLAAGFNRIGIARGFVHVDNDDTKSVGVLWLYQ